MAGSNTGTIFQITTWGESHGKGVGVVVDGCPSGLPLSEEDIQIYLNRRKPGQSKYTTPRTEADRVEILSGVFEGHTTGTPILMPHRSVRIRLLCQMLMLQKRLRLFWIAALHNKIPPVVLLNV